MGNKAKNSKESILCDTKELLKLFDKVTWHLTDARRAHGAVKRFEDAGYRIIHYCTIAMELKGENEQEKKREYIERILGSFGELLSAFEILSDMTIMTQKRSDKESVQAIHLFSDTAKLDLARILERMDSGIRKWRNSIR